MKKKTDYTDYLWGTFFALFIGGFLGMIYVIKTGGF
jgi:hypothetical protein